MDEIGVGSEAGLVLEALGGPSGFMRGGESEVEEERGGACCGALDEVRGFAGESVEDFIGVEIRGAGAFADKPGEGLGWLVGGEGLDGVVVPVEAVGDHVERAGDTEEFIEAGFVGAMAEG